MQILDTRVIGFGSIGDSPVMSPGTDLGIWPAAGGWGTILIISGGGPTPPGQIIITGIISDATTGKGIPGAKAVLVGVNTYSGVGDVNGVFSISNIIGGVYDISFSASGYESQTQKGVSISSSAVINAKLKKGMSWLTYGAIAGGIFIIGAVLVGTSREKK
jgi:hypothetical protein